jgi:hypothetical protein
MTKSCLNCGRTDEQIPVITLTFKGETLYICPQCLPNLIHRPQVLADKLPGIDVTPGSGHEH